MYITMKQSESKFKFNQTQWLQYILINPIMQQNAIRNITILEHHHGAMSQSRLTLKECHNPTQHFINIAMWQNDKGMYQI